MKALLKKDLAYLRTSKVLYIVPLVGLVLSLSGGGFVAVYMAIMAASMTQTTFTYDEYENGMSYLLTLPFTRRQYVRSKYLLALLSFLGLEALSLAMAAIAAQVRGGSVDEFVSALAVSALVGVLYTSGMIPAFIKLGTEKGRWMMLIGAVLIGAAVVLFAMGGAEMLAADISIPAAVPVVLIAAFVLIAVGSYRLSLRLIEKKEY